MAEDSGGLAGLLGWFGRPYDPQAAYEGLLSSQATKDALQARSLASIAQAFGAGAGSDARGSAIPFGTTMGNAAAAAYGGQDALIKARQEAAQTEQELATAGLTRGKLGLLPELAKAYGLLGTVGDGGTGSETKSPLSPSALIAAQQAGSAGGNVSGGGDANSANYNFAGMRAPGTSGGGPVTNPAGWQKFDTPEAGLTAIGNQVDRYASGKTTGKPLTTLNQIVSTWAPPSENDTALLLARAVKNTGFGPNDPLDLSNPTTKAKVVEALIRNEHGDRVPAAVTPELMTKVFNTPTPHVFAGSGGAPQTAGVSAVPPAAPGSTALPLPDPSAGPRGLLDLPIVPSHAGALDEGAPPRSPVPGQGAALAPQGLPPSLLAQQPDPVTAQTVNAIAAAGPGRGAPGVNAAPAGTGVGGLLNPGAVAAAAPPVDPRLAARASQVAGPGAPSEPAAPAGPPSLLAPGGSLQRTIDQNAGATVRPMPPPDSMPGQRLALPPSLLEPQPAVPAAAPVPPGAPAPVAPPVPLPPAPSPATPGLPGNVPLPPLPQFTLPTPPQMQNIPIPSPGAGTQKEQIAQKIAGISALVGMPAPAWIQDLAKMPVERATELYKAQLLQETNRINELYKTQLQIAGAGVISAAQAAGTLPYDLTKMTNEQNLKLRNSLAEKGLTYGPNGFGIDPTYLQAEAQRKQQEVEYARRAALATEGTKTDIKKREQVIDEAESSRIEQVTLNNMKNNAERIYTGPYADYKNYLNRILVSTGLDPSRANAVASFEDFTKNSGQLVRQAVQQTSARAAVQEFKLIAGALPTTETSPLGLQRVLSEYQGLANYRQAKLDAQTRYENRPGGMGTGDTAGFEAAFGKQVSPYAFVVDHMSQADRQQLFNQVLKQEGGKQELQRLQEQLTYMHGQGWGRTQ